MERNLERLFRPRSVALFGADTRPRSIGQALARNLFSGEFAGPILPVHATLPALRGVLAFKSIADLPIVPDLAVIASPAAETPGLVAALGERGTAAAVVIATDFGATDAMLRRDLLAAARRTHVRIVGPACLGLILPAVGLNASYAHAAPPAGDLAFVAHSDSLTAIFLDTVAQRGIGFSLVASLGDACDVDCADILDWLAYDPKTRAILLAIDQISDARRFLSAARTAARVKPVIVFDGGRLASVAGPDDAVALRRDRVFDAAFRRAGMLPVPLLADLTAAAGTLATGTRLAGDRLAVVGNGRGAGMMTAELWASAGGRLARLNPATIARLDGLLPPGWGQGNPINVFADAPAERHSAALAAVTSDAGVDAVLAVVCPTAIGDTEAVAAALAGARGNRRQPVAAVWLDSASRDRVAPVLAGARIAQHSSPRMAVAAFAQLIAYRQNQDMLIETPPSAPDLFTRDVGRAKRVVAAALAAGRPCLNDDEVADLLAAYGLVVRRAEAAATIADSLAAADRIGYPVALRVRSTLPSAVDTSLVALELEDRAAVEAACGRLAKQVQAAQAAQPEAAITTYLVQATAGLGDAHALCLGLAVDATFGPVISFGQGGNAAQSFADQGYGLPPLNLSLAETLIAESRVWPELRGAGDRPPAAVHAIALALVRLSQIATDLPEVVALTINPLLADATDIVVLAARIEVAAFRGQPEARLAIRPYPVELEKPIVTRSGKTLLLRPIRPEDEPALRALVAAMSPEDIRLRFFSPMRELDHRVAARLTQIDYDREMALVAVDPEAPPDTQIWGVMRVSADAENHRAEYAGSVRSDLKGQGLGRLLLEEIIAYSRSRGTGEIWGEVLAENQAMLALVRKLSFQLERNPDDPGVIHVRKPLAEAAS